MHERTDKESIETGNRFAPLFNDDGLLPCIVSDHQTGEVLMFAWMNREALEQTLDTGKATFFSRSRQKIWVKGESSGLEQLVKEIRVDCDQDVLQLMVEVQGEGVCHQGFRSCFYRSVEDAKTGTLAYRIDERSFDPENVYH